MTFFPSMIDVWQNRAKEIWERIEFVYDMVWRSRANITLSDGAAKTDLEVHGMAETDYQCLIVWFRRRMEPKWVGSENCSMEHLRWNWFGDLERLLTGRLISIERLKFDLTIYSMEQLTFDGTGSFERTGKFATGRERMDLIWLNREDWTFNIWWTGGQWEDRRVCLVRWCSGIDGTWSVDEVGGSRRRTDSWSLPLEANNSTGRTDGRSTGTLKRFRWRPRVRFG